MCMTATSISVRDASYVTVDLNEKSQYVCKISRQLVLPYPLYKITSVCLSVCRKPF
jgi:hypothetical protein